MQESLLGNVQGKTIIQQPLLDNGSPTDMNATMAQKECKSDCRRSVVRRCRQDKSLERVSRELRGPVRESRERDTSAVGSRHQVTGEDAEG
jgi:hypothetical protein